MSIAEKDSAAQTAFSSAGFKKSDYIDSPAPDFRKGT
jgi:hypothetical protein